MRSRCVDGSGTGNGRVVEEMDCGSAAESGMGIERGREIFEMLDIEFAYKYTRFGFLADVLT